MNERVGNMTRRAVLLGATAGVGAIAGRALISTSDPGPLFPAADVNACHAFCLLVWGALEIERRQNRRMIRRCFSDALVRVVGDALAFNQVHKAAHLRDSKRPVAEDEAP